MPKLITRKSVIKAAEERGLTPADHGLMLGTWLPKYTIQVEGFARGEGLYAKDLSKYARLIFGLASDYTSGATASLLKRAARLLRQAADADDEKGAQALAQQALGFLRQAE